MSGDVAPGSRTQDYFLARLAMRVDREPLKVAEEWSERFTLLRELGDYEGCRALLQAGKGWSTLPDYGRGLVYYAEGWLLDRLGDTEPAIRAYLRARDAFVRSGIDAVIPTVLTQVGSLHHDRGDYAAARRVYDQALHLTSGGDRGRLLIDIGNLHLAQEEPGDAQGAYQEALTLIEPSDHRNVGAAEHGLGNAAQAMGDLPAAQKHFAAAHAEFREARDAFGIAGAAASLGVLEVMAGDPARAVKLLEYSLVLFQAIGDTRRTADTFNNLAIARNRVGDRQIAVELWQESAAIYRELDDEATAAAVLARCAEQTA